MTFVELNGVSCHTQRYGNIIEEVSDRYDHDVKFSFQ